MNIPVEPNDGCYYDGETSLPIRIALGQRRHADVARRLHALPTTPLDNNKNPTSGTFMPS